MDDFYDLIADHYDDFQEDIDPSSWAEKILAMASGNMLCDTDMDDMLLVDLGCGSGLITAELHGQSGFETIGIDRSEMMLSRAMETDFKILWVLQDIRSFDIGRTAQIFVSTTDTVNHLTDPDDVRKLFARIGECLEPGGVFIFDAGTKDHFEKTLGDNIFYRDEDDATLLWVNSWDGEVSTSEMTLFETEDGQTYERYDGTVKERFYDRDFFVECAAKAGLEPVHEEADGTERVFYVFRRKNENE